MRTRTRLVALLCAALATLCLGAAPVAAAETVHPFRGTITGERISKFEQFKDTCGVTVDSKGSIYVADYYQNRVVVFNEKEEFVRTITGINPLDAGGVAPIDGPCDLAVDSSGRLYVSNYHRDVVAYPPVATPLATSESTGIAVDPGSDNLYVDERTSVAVLDSSGTELSRIGAGSLADGYGVAVSSFGATSGYVYVADAASNTIKVYDPLTSLSDPIEVIVGDGTPRGGFKSLVDTDLAVDPADGHLYVVDNLEPHFEKPEAVVYEFSATGHYRGQVPHSVAEGQSSFLVDGEGSGVAIGEGGNIYVTSGNYEDAAVVVFGPSDSTPTQLLTVSKAGAGSGTVFSSPAGLRCGGACVGEFSKDSNVSLTAAPAPHNRLVGWSGCAANPTPTTCQVTMNGDLAVSAEFEPTSIEEPPVEEPPVKPPLALPGGPPPLTPLRTLTVATTGLGGAGGTVRSAPAGIDCGAFCSRVYARGTPLSLSAQPAPGSVFLGWGGCEGASGATCTLALGADRVVVAAFGPAPAGPLRVRKAAIKGATATLTVAVPGPGTLAVAGKWLRSAKTLPLAAGDVVLRLGLSPAGSSALAAAKSGRLEAKAKLAFAPLEGGPTIRLTRALAFGVKRK